MKNIITAAGLLLLILAIGCQEGPEISHETTWWVHADTHVGHATYEHQLSNAIEDVNALNISDYAITLGDCVDERKRHEIFTDPHVSWSAYESKMNTLHHDWTYVLGNHDNDGREIPVHAVTTPNYFSKNIHGVRIIGISDEHLSDDYTRHLEMSREQIEFVMDELNNAPDKPTIIMSHQGIQESREGRDDGIPFLKENVIPDIDQYNIVLVVNGHWHEWQIIENVLGYGFDQIAINDILYDMESSFMTIRELDETIEISFRFRNHQDRQWITVQGREKYILEIPKQ